jgi:hypothetical protein
MRETTTVPDTGGGGGTDREQRVLVIAAERCVGPELLDELRERTASPARVRVVAPALVTRLQYWASDDDSGRARAADRLNDSIERCTAAGIEVEGAVGDSDPLQVIDDEVRGFAPDEILVATHPRDTENWLEHDVVPQARSRYSIPIAHVVVDAASGTDAFVPPDAEPPAVVRERHRVRDVAFLSAMTVLAVVGTLVSLLLAGADVSNWVLGAWVLVMDLGVKLVLIVVLWRLFLRRGRADRLDY